jgi:hypothetical protein
MKSILDKLQIKAQNAGVCTGPDGWLETSELITSYNPTTGLPIASVSQATTETYGRVVAHGVEAFPSTRTVDP